MNDNKIIIPCNKKLESIVTIKKDNAKFLISYVKPYNTDTNIVIKHVDNNNDIIGLLEIPSNLLYDVSMVLLKEHGDILNNFKS